MKKFNILEELLNEYVDSPTHAKIGFIEADNAEQAMVIAKLLYPHLAVKVEPIEEQPGV